MPPAFVSYLFILQLKNYTYIIKSSFFCPFTTFTFPHHMLCRKELDPFPTSLSLPWVCT